MTGPPHHHQRVGVLVKEIGRVLAHYQLLIPILAHANDLIHERAYPVDENVEILLIYSIFLHH